LKSPRWSYNSDFNQFSLWITSLQINVWSGKKKKKTNWWKIG